ncbi:hypothetical protein [Sulfurirhabdus autotrophica]|uniref:Lipoprotein n=1 Tax=Sulfurirhabdus autotrophica TaxID=1706046 RepID=A0A4R3XPV2_9PROT|nr:hypothetical protein [Sulfurirhabdus autotrophica]TCV80115.1 hypothetical protein EDC63_13028 [Sulfurirhabdus autotrophica]
MKSISLSFVILALIGLGGCASFIKPTPETLKAVPVVQFGKPTPANGDFILFFPAGKPIPVVTVIKGSALTQEAEHTLNVTLKKDIYAYKRWVSFDHKTWQRGDEALGINIEIKIPGPEHPKPGLIKVQVDLK